jgi:hypothetical protein
VFHEFYLSLSKLQIKLLRSAFIFLLVSGYYTLNAQSVNTLMGARTLSLANNSSTLKDEWSLFNNVGGLSSVKNVCGAVAYEIRPSLPGATRMAATFIVPSKFGSAALGVFRFGDELYSEQIISGGFSNQFGIASLGVKVNYVQYRAEGFGIKKAVSINFGGIATLTEKISIGAYITNLNRPKISLQNDERISTSIVAGLNFKASEKVILLTEIAKDLDHDATIKGAIEYTVHKKVFFRTGFNLNPSAGFFGLGFVTKKLKIDYGLQYSFLLNFYHQASVIYSITKKKK